LAATPTCLFLVFTFQRVEKTALARCEFPVLFEDGALWYTWQDDVAHALFI
jgi:hypothetical protein